MNTQITDIFSDMIIDHILEVREQIPELRNSLFVINCEANLPYASPSAQYDLAKKVGGRFNYMILEDDQRKETSSLRTNNSRAIIVTAGTRTDNKSKLFMVNGMTQILNQGRIHFHRDFVSTAFERDPSKGGLDLRSIIVRQMKSFRRRCLPLARGQETIKYRKMQYEGAEDDDLSMCVIMGPFTMHRAQEIAYAKKRIDAHRC